MEDMARKELKQKAIEMRMRQMSYAEIKEALGVSKSTLSDWLRNLPLGERNIELIAKRKHRQIERYRNSMKAKAQKKLDIAYASISEKLGILSDRDVFIAGLFLYWAEGSKSMNASVALTNTNPQMILFFIEWMRIMGISKSSLRISLQLYSDMDVEKQLSYWSRKLKIDRSQFYNPRIKKSAHASITYTNGFGQGTCTVSFGSKKMKDLVMMGIKRLEDMMFENEFRLIFPKMCAY